MIRTSYQGRPTTNPALVTPNGLKPLAKCVLTSPPINNPYFPTALPDYTLTSITLHHLCTRGSDSQIWEPFLSTGLYRTLHAELLANMRSYITAKIIDDFGPYIGPQV